MSALRHSNHRWLFLAGVAAPAMPSDAALRTVPKKPETAADMHEALKLFHLPSAIERYTLSHMTPPGESTPRPAAPMLTTPARLQLTLPLCCRLRPSCASPPPKRASIASQDGEWRTQPLTGRCSLDSDLDQPILDALHLAKLGLPKTPWKFGIMNNASCEKRARRSASSLLSGSTPSTAGVKITIVFARTSGERGSPGTPIAIATIVVIIAKDLQARGVDVGESERDVANDADTGEPPTASRSGNGSKGGRGGRGSKGGRGRAAFASRVRSSSGTAEPAETSSAGAEVEHMPTAAELSADPEELTAIRDMFGMRAQTLISVLLSFDAYFKWYFPFAASIPLSSDYSLLEAHALDNMRNAIDMYVEVFERVSIRLHKSFLPHGAVFKVTRDILEVGDVWAVDLSPLELQNTETKRVATSSGSKRLVLTSEGFQRQPMRGKSGGPTQMVKMKGYSTTMALSILKNLLATQQLRRGEGFVSVPESRRNERLFGVTGAGHTKLP
eukprot:6184803-Pleurochrysis_carterae.AAC.5